MVSPPFHSPDAHSPSPAASTMPLHEDNENERELVFRTNDQEYGQVIKVLGSQQIEAMCFDGEIRIAHIGGMREQEDIPAQVILKYTADETLRMRECGEFPGNARFNDPEPEFNGMFEYGDDTEVDIDDI
ncbi:hypothetical protein B0H17DRAFT_1119110 [Mycena rosella]|uniref:S1-like domain-containing protein n=1 Tax=Mycena rosella TaxID=1033263 RepID=A0AAD7B2E8_MYCRO|nr:hypothetical protein B0H17DRAFT_1119110 [Mycena rosella]